MKKISILMMLLMVLAVVSCKKKKEDNPVIPNKPNKPVTPDNPSSTLTVEAFKVSIDENPEAGKSLGTVSAKSSDDKATLKYVLKEQSRAGALSIDAATGELKVAEAGLFDFEQGETITAKCDVSSGTTTQTADITITLKDVKGEPFITKWTVPAGGEVELEKNGFYSDYDITVDWGDGITEKNVYQHTYTKGGDYMVKVTGKFPGLQMTKNITTVMAWGDNQWATMKNMFAYCTNIQAFEAKDLPDLSNVTNMSYMFYSAGNFNGDISGWNTQNVTNMRYMFARASNFNGDISGWNTQNVTDMRYMFYLASNFNGDISGWNTENVTNMEGMFDHASNFNGDISGWNTQNVTYMRYMFYSASNFNGDISGWNVDKVLSYDFFALDSGLTCDHTPQFGGTVPTTGNTGCK